MVQLKNLKNDILINIINKYGLILPKMEKYYKKDYLKLIENNLNQDQINQILKKKPTSNKINKKDKIKTQKISISKFIFSQKMYLELLNRIEILEKQLSNNKFNTLIKKDLPDIDQKYIFQQLKYLIPNNLSGNTWILIDNFYSKLSIQNYQYPIVDNMLLDLFYADKIELSEGGNSVYKIKVRGAKFGRISIKI